MRCPFRFRGSLAVVSCLLSAALATQACTSGETVEAGAVGTAAAGPLGITSSATYLTIENRAGVPIVDIKIEIEPRGLRPPFRATAPRIEGGAKIDVPFKQFRSADGTPFQRGGLRTRSLKVAATDVTGKAIEQELPFE